MAAQARLKALLEAEGYDVQRDLGQGQFGKVVLARARASGSLVAVKMVAESFSSANERSMIGRPAHPNVLQIFKSIHDAATDVNVCFLEFCNGGDMEAWLARENRALVNRELLVFITQVASGLQFLHSQNIAHRDIKPSNILLSIEDGWTTYKLGDFGTARDKTMMETLAGTPYFMAPEVEAGSYGKEIDLWSLGCTVFFCCTLRQLFDAHNRVELRDMVSRVLTPEAVRTRLAAAAHCRLTEEERERLAFAVSALVQINPAQRMSVAELLQQFQPQARVIDVRTSDEHTVSISVAHRPSVRNLALQVADVFSRSAENLYLHDRHGELTDARLEELLWSRALIELRLTDIEAYMGASVPSPDDTEYEAVELQDSPDASHALACLPALANSNELRLRSRLPEYEALASLRDTVTREQAAASEMIARIRFAKELLAGIERVPEDDAMLSALATIEKHVGVADSVVKEAAVFFCSGDSPIAALVRVLSTMQLPSSVTMAELPQLLHKHLATQATRTEAFCTSQRTLLRELLHKHAGLSELFAPHGAVTRATQALDRLRTHMQGVVERAAQMHAQQAMTTGVSATVAALQTQHAAELAQLGRAHAEAMAKAHEGHQAAVAKLGSERAAEINSLSRQHAEAMARAADQHAAIVAQMRAEHATALERVRQECAHASSEADAVTEAELREARAALDKARAALEEREDEVGLKPSDAPFAARLTAVLLRFYERSKAQALAQAACDQLPLKQLNETLIREKQELAARLQAANATLQVELVQAKQQAADSEEKMNAALVHSEQVESEALAVRESIAALKANVESSHARVQELEASNAQLATEVADRDRTNAALRERMTIFEKQHAELQAHIDSLERAGRLAKDELLTKTELMAQSESSKAALVTENAALKQRLAEETERGRAAAQRIAQLENGMRESAAMILQHQTALSAREADLKALRADMARSMPQAVSPAQRPPIPLFTPPPVTPPAQPSLPQYVAPGQALQPPARGLPASPQSELASLRAENVNLRATVAKLTADLEQTRPTSIRINELEIERDRLRKVNEQLRADLDAARSSTQRSAGAAEVQQLVQENEHLTATLRELQDQIAAERAARIVLENERSALEDEARGLQEHVRELAQENLQLRHQHADDDLAEVIVETARSLYPAANLHDVDECRAQLRSMIGRGACLSLLALSDVQFGDRVYVMHDKQVLQRPGQQPLRLADPDQVEGDRVYSVVLIEEGTVHVTA